MTSMLICAGNDVLSCIDTGEKDKLDEKRKILDSLDSSIKFHIVDTDESLVNTYKDNAEILKRDFGYVLSI